MTDDGRPVSARPVAARPVSARPVSAQPVSTPQVSARPVSARTASAASWLVGGRLVARGLDFIALLVLARFLTPADFGIVAIAMTLILFVEAVVDLPVGQVLLRLPQLERCHLDTAFTLNALRGLGLAALLAALAVPFAHAYGDARLVPLICTLGLAPALRGLQSPRMALYAKQIDFRRTLVIDLTGKLASLAVAAALAFWTRSYWAIAAGTVIAPAAMVATSYALAPYRVRVSLETWPLFADFVGWTTAAQAFTAANWQCDRLLLGRYVPHATLGVFTLANDLAYLPEQALIKPIVVPLASAFTLIRDDPPRLRAAYARTAVAVLMVGTPVMLGLTMLAEPAVRFALGGKWLAAVPLLGWLAPTLIPPLFAAPLPSLAMALGRPRQLLWISAAEAAIRVPLIAVGAVWFGVGGVVAARVAAAGAMTLVAMLFVRALIGTPVHRQLADTWRVAAGGAMLVLVLSAVRPALAGAGGVALGVGLAACGGGGLAAYVATLAVLWRLSGRPAGLERAATDYLRHRGGGARDALRRLVIGGRRGAAREEQPSDPR